jgi:hypothetical protein
MVWGVFCGRVRSCVGDDSSVLASGLSSVGPTEQMAAASSNARPSAPLRDAKDDGE